MAGWAAAVFFLGMGVVALLVPEQIPAIFGGKAETPASRNEVRAVYGGYGVGISALAAYAQSSSRPEAPGWLQCLGMSMGFMAAGRVTGVLIEREWALWPTWAFVIVEIGLAAALLAAGGVFVPSCLK